MQNKPPLPEPKPYLRKSADIMTQAQQMMTPKPEPVIEEEEEE